MTLGEMIERIELAKSLGALASDEVMVFNGQGRLTSLDLTFEPAFIDQKDRLSGQGDRIVMAHGIMELT